MKTEHCNHHQMSTKLPIECQYYLCQFVSTRCGMVDNWKNYSYWCIWLVWLWER